MAYQQMQGYPVYQNPYTNPYQDRLAQLQNQYQQAIPAAQPQQQVNQGLLWVQGEAGVKSYLVAPGASVMLFDSEGSNFYIKSVDQMGVPTVRTFEYKEIFPNQMPPVVAESKEPEYATHEDVEYLKKQIEELKQKMEVKHEPIVQPTRRRPKPDDESGTDAND